MAGVYTKSTPSPVMIQLFLLTSISLANFMAIPYITDMPELEYGTASEEVAN